jgi:anti-anti-sigma factor
VRGWQDFNVQRDVAGSTALLTVYGQVDLAAAERLDAALTDAMRFAPVSYVVVNLRGCAFLDSSGLKVLRRAERDARAMGKTLDCENATGIVRDVLAVPTPGRADAVRAGGAPASRESSASGATIRLVRAPDSPGAARAAVREVLRGRGLANDTVDQAVLVVSELVTNAVEHGRGRIQVATDVGPRYVHLEVRDEGPPVEIVPSLGLCIVQHVGATWGVSTEPTTVWCKVRVRGDQHE